MSELKHRAGDLIDNRYQVRKIMGSGAFGTVYGCRDTELDVPVAVKELHVIDEAERAVALAQFRAEAQAFVAPCAIPISCRATTNRWVATGTSAPSAA